MKTSRLKSIVLLILLATGSRCAENFSARPKNDPVAPIFTLGNARYVKDRDDTLMFIIPVRALKPEYFKKPGLKVAYVGFNESVKAPPKDLKSDPDSFELKTEKDGQQDLIWQVASSDHKVTGRAHMFWGVPEYHASADTAIMRFGMHLPGKLVDNDFGLFLLDQKDLHPGSNVVLWRMSSFVAGDSKEVFEAMVKKLPSAAQTILPEVGHTK